MLRCFDAVDSGHANIKQYDIGPQFLRHQQCLLAVPGLADNRVLAAIADHLPETIARRRFIVDDQNIHASCSSRGNRKRTQ
jgi:hypothetical protein